MASITDTLKRQLESARPEDVPILNELIRIMENRQVVRIDDDDLELVGLDA